MEMKEITPEQIAQMKRVILETCSDNSNQAIIQDNKIIFPFKETIYRCRMPNQEEQADAENAQDRLKAELILKGHTITRRQLIKNLKEKQNINIKELEKEKEEILKKYQDVLLDLAVVDSKELEKIEKLRKEKNEREEDLAEIITEIAECLSPCLEEKAKVEYYRYLAYLCAEKQTEKDTYAPIWASYEEFKKDGSGLPLVAVDNMNKLLLDVRA